MMSPRHLRGGGARARGVIAAPCNARACATRGAGAISHRRARDTPPARAQISPNATFRAFSEKVGSSRVSSMATSEGDEFFAEAEGRSKSEPYLAVISKLFDGGEGTGLDRAGGDENSVSIPPGTLFYQTLA